MNIKKERIIFLFFLIIASLVSFFLGEFIIRYISNHNKIYTLEMIKYAQEFKTEDPENTVSRLPKPNAEGTIMGSLLKLNSLGFRNSEVSPEKPLGTKRILFVGKSETLGWGVDADKIFPVLIEHDLNKTASPEKQYQVINAGVANYSAHDQFMLLKRHFDRIKPDLVPIVYTGAVAQKFSSPGFLQKSYLASFLGSIFYSVVYRSTNESLLSFYDNYYSPMSPGWLETIESIKKTKEFCNEKKVKMFMILVPDLHDMSPDSPYLKVIKFVQSELGKINVDSIYTDSLISDKFSGHELNYWVSPDDAHPNADTHRLIADDILKKLNETNF